MNAEQSAKHIDNVRLLNTLGMIPPGCREKSVGKIYKFLFFATANGFSALLRNKLHLNLLRLAIGGFLDTPFSWHETRSDGFYDMKKIIGACLVLVFVVVLGLLPGGKSFGSQSLPAPTNAAPASINGPVSNASGSASQQ